MAANDEREYTSCLEKVLTFRLPTGVPKIIILLFGAVGAGKSSIVSTVDSLFKGRMSRRAAHGQGIDGPYTRTLTKYSFKVERPGANDEVEIQEAPFVLWDTPGWFDDTDYKSGELGYILDGNLPNRFDLCQAISPQSMDFITPRDQADKVHCMCFVVPCARRGTSSEREFTGRVKEIKEYAKNRGIPALLFLTKIDQHHPELASDIPLVNRIGHKMQVVADACGIGGTKDVFPVQSFSSEYEPEYATCLDKLLAFRAPKDLPKINILLFGSSGSGKTSIVSTVDSLFRGRISRRVPHGRGIGSHTRALTKYSFELELPRANEGELETQEAPFVIWDTPEWYDYDYKYKRGELGYILGGNLPNRFDLSQAISPQSQDFITAPDQADKVHCMCFVLPCKSFCYNGEDMCHVRDMKKYATDRGIPTLVFLTKVDQYDPEVAADISKLKTSKGIMKIVQEVARNFGVGSTNNVLPIKTLSSEYEADKAVGILTLRALQHALYAVLDHMEVAQMDLNQWQPTTVLGSSPLQVSQKDRPHRAEAVATSTASTVCAQAEKDCDMESADWEAVPPQAGPH